MNPYFVHMKALLTLLASLFTFLVVNAQDDAKKDSTVVIFEKVEVESQFPGGLQEWKKFLIRNLQMDAVVKKAAPKKARHWQQTALVRFLVDKDGTVIAADVMNEKNLHEAVITEAKRVILLSPKWSPAIQNGRPVKSYRTQPITFNIEVE